MSYVRPLSSICCFSSDLNHEGFEVLIHVQSCFIAQSLTLGQKTDSPSAIAAVCEEKIQIYAHKDTNLAPSSYLQGCKSLLAQIDHVLQAACRTI